VRARFRFLAENGADIVVGHHPHVLQGLEWFGNVPIAYSLGDFLFHNSLPSVRRRNFVRMEMGLYAPKELERDADKFSRGALLTVQISGARKSISWQPFRQDPDLRPRLCEGETRIQDLKRLNDLSVALQNPEDWRHFLADSIVDAAHRANIGRLRIAEVVKLALRFRPKWRYVPLGMKWLLQRLKV
jgi:hypothetical protein